MIVPMKKVFLLVQNKDMVSAMEVLQGMGLLHVEHEKNPSGPTLHELKENARILHRVIDILSLHKESSPQAVFDDWQEKALKIIHLADRIQHIKDDLGKRRALIETWEPWGDFDLRDIAALREKGIFIQCVEYPKGEKADVPQGVILEPVFTKGGTVRALAISEREMPLPVHVLSLPPVGLNHLKEQYTQGHKVILGLEQKIRDAAKCLNGFKKALRDIQQQLDFQEVYQGRGEKDSLAYLKGYVPADQSGELHRKAKTEQWGLLVTDPDDTDQVPTLLRNPRWIETINPVFRLIDVLPGYKEFDISFFFLLFFSIFFGMLIGDGGYGLIFILLTMFFQKKFRGRFESRTPFVLMYVLSGCTVVWGILSGTFFGQEWLVFTPLRPLFPWLRENSNIQLLCFLIGAIHLSIAHIWRAVVKLPSLTSLGEAGWLLVVWGMYHIAKMLILGITFPPYARIFLIAGPVLILFFTKIQKSFLKTIAAGLGDFLLRIANTFADLVSYIRLFAVGLATVAVADAFNAVAGSIGFNSFWAGFGSALVLIAGHLFNIVLGSMAILVHGLRLNVLEFSSHLNMEWSGIRYSPFQKIKDKQA